MDIEVTKLAKDAAEQAFDEVKNFQKGTPERTAQYEVAATMLAAHTEREKIEANSNTAELNAEVEREKFETESETRRYESDAQDRRSHEEQETKKFQINKENVMNGLKAAGFVVVSLLGIGVHVMDVKAEEKLGYDVSDKSGLIEKVSSATSKLMR